jgi:NTE family protein
MRALVLGGGGYTGFAWELGILAGLASAGVTLADADVVLGTSAGSIMGALLASGVDLEARYAEELAPTTEVVRQLPAGFGVRWGLAMLRYRDPERLRVKLGAMALAAKTPPEAARRAEVIERLAGITHWPKGLRVTAVDAETGELSTFDADSGVDLADAVAASTALPGIRPPATINGRRYIDAGVRSTTNTDVVAGYEKIVVIAPVPRCVTAGELIAPDRASQEATGRSLKQMNDPARRAASARAGRAQASTIAPHLATLWP